MFLLSCFKIDFSKAVARYNCATLRHAIFRQKFSTFFYPNSPCGLRASYTTLGHNSGQLLASTSGRTYEGSKHTGPCFDYQRWLVVGEPFSDHNSITFTLNSAPYISRICKKFVYAFNKADWSHLRSLFQYSLWDLALAGEDVYDNWTALKDIFFAAVDDCIPKYRQKKRLTAPWIIKDLITCKLCRKN